VVVDKPLAEEDILVGSSVDKHEADSEHSRLDCIVDSSVDTSVAALGTEEEDNLVAQMDMVSAAELVVAVAALEDIGLDQEFDKIEGGELVVAAAASQRMRPGRVNK